MLTFVKNVVEQSAEAQYSVIDLLRKTMAGNEQQRGYSEIHASDLTKPDFCPRQVALLDILKRPLKPRYVSSAQRATYDMGNMVADLVRERWLGDKSIGHWWCPQCAQQALFAPRPSSGGCGGPVSSRPHLWQYVEVKFQSTIEGHVGSIDLIVNLGAPRLYVVELKIMKPEEFQKIVGPLAEHRLRTNLYLRLIDDSGSPYRSQLNLHRAVVLYVSRGYGKKNEEHADSILPFKEYWVERDDSDLHTPLAKALAVKMFRKNKQMPYGICDVPTCKIARYCPVRMECFNGAFPPA